MTMQEVTQIILMILFSSCIVLLLTVDCEAQTTNYVLCENPVSGARAVFTGTSCPPGWVFVQVVQ